MVCDATSVFTLVVRSKRRLSWLKEHDVTHARDPPHPNDLTVTSRDVRATFVTSEAYKSKECIIFGLREGEYG